MATILSSVDEDDDDAFVTIEDRSFDGDVRASIVIDIGAALGTAEPGVDTLIAFGVTNLEASDLSI